jgi:hypothetical protein
VCENSLVFLRENRAKRGMSRFKPYSPDQAYLLPPSVKDELEEGHLCFFVQKVVGRL